MAKLALYRKYRPLNFDELFGQEHIARTLKNAVNEHSFSHAYLFCGPRGTGKTSAARILAKAINCLGPKDGNPCNKCANCLSINENQAVDIIEIDAASHTQVDNIREVIVERAKFAPTSLKYKVYIIDEAHMLSKSSFNALLKTLEEPPEHAVFILATTEPQKIIPTIQSRTQRFDFHKIDKVSMEKRVLQIATAEKIKIDEEAMGALITSSEGGFRDAISMLDKLRDATKGDITGKAVLDLLGTAGPEKVDQLIISILKHDTTAALTELAALEAEGADPLLLSKDLLGRLRETAMNAAKDLPTAEMKDYSLESILSLIETIVGAHEKYKFQPIPSLPLEMAIITYTKNIRTQPQLVTENIASSTAEKSKPTTKSFTQKPMNLSGEAKWQQFLLEVKTKNNSVNAILKSCQPTIEDGVATLVFPYKFHKERIEDMKNLTLIEDLLAKVYGQKITVKCVLRPMTEVARPVEARQVVKDDLLDEAIDIFGGEVVE